MDPMSDSSHRRLKPMSKKRAVWIACTGLAIYYGLILYFALR